MKYLEIFSFENLYNSYLKCQKGVRWKPETQRFINRDLIFLNQMKKSLEKKIYKADKFKEFDIMERGKPRHIMAHTFKDRIVQRCLCDNYLVPILSKSLIYDCGATIKGKGILFSQKRVNTHLQRYFRKHSTKGYCLTLDIHHYFENISHKILLEKLRKVIEDDDTYSLLEQLIKNFKGDSGLGLGSQISQILALWYLNDIDHFIKEELKITFYGRYMDDFYLIHPSFNCLKYCWKEIEKKLNALGLLLNSKSKIHKLSNGFTFTKVRYILTETGKVLHMITTKTFKQMKRKIKKGVDIKNILPSWQSYLSRFNCYEKKRNFFQKYLINLTTQLV